MEKKFEIDMENIQNDLAIEGMTISPEDIHLFEKYSNQEMALEDVIKTIQGNTMEKIWEIYMKPKIQYIVTKVPIYW